MRALLLIPLLAAILAAPVAAETRQVTIHTTEGSEVNGKVEFGSLTLLSDLGKFDIDIFKVLQITFKGGQATVQMRDNSRLVGTLSATSFKVASSLGDIEIPAEKIRAISFRDAPPAKPQPANPPSNPPAAAGTSEAAVNLTLDAEVKPEARLEGSSRIVGQAALTADASRIYFLDAMAGKVVALDTTSMTVVGSAEVPRSPVSLSVASGDRTLWVIAPSTVCVFDLPALTPRKTFQIEHKLVDVLAVDDTRAFGALTGSVVVLDADKSAAIKPDGDTFGGPFSPIPGTSRFYQRDGWTSWKAVPGRPGGLELQLYKPATPMPPALDLVPSSDGRFAVLRTGSVVRLSRSHLADLQPCAQVSPSISGIALREKYLLFSEDGYLKVHDSGNFELKASSKIGILAIAALCDATSGKVWVFGTTARSAWQPGAASATGTWFRYKF